MASVALSLGSSALSSFLQVVLDRVASREFLNLFIEQKHDHHHQLLKKLKRILLLIRAVLNDTENNPTQNPAANEWMDHLQDALYHADDLMDQISTQVLQVKANMKQSPGDMIDQVSLCTSCLSNEFLNEIMPKLGEIVNELEGFAQQIEILGLGLKKCCAKEKQPHQLPSTCLVDESVVYGRDDDKEKIIQLLLSNGSAKENDDVLVVPIVGLGGVGKTTLAQLVYNDKRVKQHFDVCAWVCVSEEYNAVAITETLLRELELCLDSFETFNSLQVKLQQGLTGKRFLFVLDNVWNRDYCDWDVLKKPFEGGRTGSKIIVTTRDENVALTMHNGPRIHYLDLMSDEDGWSLFERHAFDGNPIRDPEDPELEVIGKEIVKKCKGLPLAIKVLAGLLRSNSSAQKWSNVLISDVWLPMNGQNNNILPALRLSYTHMPSYLKRCFAYCALFHKDYRFKKEEVILLWNANNLLEFGIGNGNGNGQMVEDIGDQYLTELVQRSVFQQSSDHQYFFMHDLVNDLARLVSGKYCLRLEDDQKENHVTVDEVRHLSYRSTFWDVFGKFKHINQAKHLRTFLPLRMDRVYVHSLSQKFSQKFLYEILPTFRSLRVLSLSGYAIVDLPDSFQSLKQLRFLDLSFTQIENLPHWICTFYNLQTLLLSDCKNLIELPADIGKLINLRHLDITGVPLKKMPIQISELKCLQVLTNFVCSQDPGSTVKELGKIFNLHGKLTVSGLEKVVRGMDAIEANMKEKMHLEKLSLKWNGTVDDSREAIEVLSNLQPCKSIKCLAIDGYGGTSFPNWLKDSKFHNMVSLRLSDCENCFSLPALGQLLSLKFLTVEGMLKISTIGMEFYGKGSVFETFPSLQTLRFDKMQDWKEWQVPEKGVFCSLQELYIINCPKLVGEIPKHLLSLRKFEVCGCPQLVLSDGRLSILSSLQIHSLQKLKISNMPSLKEFFSSELKILIGLEELEIGDCPNLVSLGPLSVNRGGLPANLRALQIYGCPKLEFLSQEWTDTSFVYLEQLRIREPCDTQKDLLLSLLPKIRNLEIQDCRGLEMLSVQRGDRNLALLESLLIWGCENLRSFPEEGFSAANLSWIMLYGCKKLKSLPDMMRTLLPCLRSLHIWNCPEIECFPGEGLPFCLETLEIYNSEKLMNRKSEWDLNTLPCLTALMIGETEEAFFNGDWLLPHTLRVLRVFRHHTLEKFNSRSLQNLISLETLCIWGCHLLQLLPETGLPLSLSRLVIHDCPLLKSRLNWENGKDWCKVAHVSCLMVDGEFVP